MKSISLVVALALAFLISTHSRTPGQTNEKAQTTSDNLSTQATPKRADAPRIRTSQEAKKAIQEGILGPIALKASNSLSNYPSSPQIRRIGNPRIRNILERGRNLLEAAKTANRWNAIRLSGFASQLDQYLKEAEAAAKSAKPTRETTPTEDCAAARDKCNQRCHDRDASYWCFFNCRLEYLVCLGGTLFNRFATLLT